MKEMIPKEAIEKAIEGGWKDIKRGGVNWIIDGEHRSDFLCIEWSPGGVTDDYSGADAALDPSFWQSLGKALGWVAFSTHEHGSDEPCNGFCVQDVKGTGWKTRAHRFYDLILTNGHTVAFWEELLIDG